jgi:hypothetical protein
MPSLSGTRVTGAQEESDTGEGAAVAEAIRLHEWVQMNLRRLAAMEKNARGHRRTPDGVGQAAAPPNPVHIVP